MKKLRHVVLLSFYDVCTPAQIKTVEDGLNALPSKIPAIKAYEWGINNSPEKVNKGFTHGYLLTFDSETDRDSYLVNPNHLAFKKVMGPCVSDILVLDYWAR
ncbi:MAG: Dabb family protein [Massilia sp.]|nr:Dabb family protein [Massilia sp.]